MHKEMVHCFRNHLFDGLLEKNVGIISKCPQGPLDKSIFLWSRYVIAGSTA